MSCANGAEAGGMRRNWLSNANAIFIYVWLIWWIMPMLMMMMVYVASRQQQLLHRKGIKVSPREYTHTHSHTPPSLRILYVFACAMTLIQDRNANESAGDLASTNAITLHKSWRLCHPNNNINNSFSHQHPHNTAARRSVPFALPERSKSCTSWQRNCASQQIRNWRDWYSCSVIRHNGIEWHQFLLDITFHDSFMIFL